MAPACDIRPALRAALVLGAAVASAIIALAVLALLGLAEAVGAAVELMAL